MHMPSNYSFENVHSFQTISYPIIGVILMKVLSQKYIFLDARTDECFKQTFVAESNKNHGDYVVVHNSPSTRPNNTHQSNTKQFATVGK